MQNSEKQNLTHSIPTHNPTQLITLTFHLIQSQKHHKDAKGDFTLLMSSIQTACKLISSKVRKAGIANLYGIANSTTGGDNKNSSTNSTGDIQKKLDVIANDVFINSLKSSNQVSIILSEEEEKPIYIHTEDKSQGKYIVAFDPLDGSSNIDVNVTIGSIFGIWKQRDPNNINEDILQKGVDLIASGYCVYGSSTQMVTCIDNTVNCFTLDPSLGEFILTNQNIKIKNSYPIYSINEGNYNLWDDEIKQYITDKKKKTSSLRYIGSMVADIHRTLLYGGIFLYPADKKNKSGKLRLMYECNPLAFVIEAAGGKASTGTERILEIQPEDIHQRCGVIMGSPGDVDEVCNLYLYK